MGARANAHRAFVTIGGLDGFVSEWNDPFAVAQEPEPYPHSARSSS